MLSLLSSWSTYPCPLGVKVVKRERSLMKWNGMEESITKKCSGEPEVGCVGTRESVDAAFERFEGMTKVKQSWGRRRRAEKLSIYAPKNMIYAHQRYSTKWKTVKNDVIKEPRRKQDLWDRRERTPKAREATRELEDDEKTENQRNRYKRKTGWYNRKWLGEGWR